MLGGSLQLYKILPILPVFPVISHTEIPPNTISMKAPRIPASTWDGYKEDITALYTSPDGTLEKVMDTMKQRHGFLQT